MSILCKQLLAHLQVFLFETFQNIFPKYFLTSGWLSLQMWKLQIHRAKHTSISEVILLYILFSKDNFKTKRLAQSRAINQKQIMPASKSKDTFLSGPCTIIKINMQSPLILKCCPRCGIVTRVPTMLDSLLLLALFLLQFTCHTTSEHSCSKHRSYSSLSCLKLFEQSSFSSG